MKLLCILLPVVLVGISINAAAEWEEVSLNPSMLTFCNRFRTAVMAEDTRQIIRLTHPHSRQCINADDRDYYYSRIVNNLVRILGRNQIIEDVRVKKVNLEELLQNDDEAEGENMRWPITPEEQIIITYRKDGFENKASLYIARENDEWKWVHVCTQ